MLWVESHPRQLIFLRKSDCLGCAVLLCLVCLFDLACFFLSSLSSLIKTCTCSYFFSPRGTGDEGCLSVATVTKLVSSSVGVVALINALISIYSGGGGGGGGGITSTLNLTLRVPVNSAMYTAGQCILWSYRLIMHTSLSVTLAL